MKNSIWNQKIPTVLGMIAIVIGIFATSALTKNTTIFQGRASSSEDPKEVRVTNITDTSFTVSYQTSSSVTGSLVYGKDKNLDTTAFDQRDQAKNVLPHNIHFITVRNLSPQSTYFFSIISGQTTYSKGSEPFQVITAQTPSIQPFDTTIKGSILLPSGGAPKEALVYATTDNASPIASLVNADGSYTLPIGNIKTSDLKGFADLTDKNLTLLIFDSDTSSQAIVSSQETEIPTIILSKNYDFTLTQSPVATPEASLGFPTLQATESALPTNPLILSPSKGEQFTDEKPLFKGIAVPNSTVSVAIHSDAQITTQVTADSRGNWTYRPDSNLAPGNHTITITSQNKSGILQTITRSFTVFASGTQVEEPATPSATLIPTDIPTIEPTATIIPTQIPLPTKPPESGNSSATIDAIIGLGVSALGFLIFLASRGRIHP